MLARYAVLPSPSLASAQVLLLSKSQAPINHAESTLLQVLILKQLKVPLESITYEKQGEGSPLWLTNCSKKVSVRKVHWNPNLRSVQCRNRVAFLPPPVQIVHGNVQINVAARRLDTNYQRFRIRAARQTRFVHVNFRRKHFEMKSLIVQQRHRVSDDHVRHFANRFPYHLVARFHFRPR